MEGTRPHLFCSISSLLGLTFVAHHDPGTRVAPFIPQRSLSRIAGDGVKCFGRPAAADPSLDPGPKLAQRILRQSDPSAPERQRGRPRDQVGPRNRQEPQLAIGRFHVQGVAAVATDNLDSLEVERMDGQSDRRERPAPEHVRPRARRSARLGFGSALGLSVSGLRGGLSRSPVHEGILPGRSRGRDHLPGFPWCRRTG